MIAALRPGMLRLAGRVSDGVIINWLSADEKFKCPCHGSGFVKTGINIEGPAPRPLERYKVTMAEDGQILVDKNTKYQQEKGQWELDGAKDSNARGLEKARSLLERHEEERPALDPATDEALNDFIARREAVLPDGVS